jgi:hypothetical protein
LIADLDDDDYTVRSQATNALEEIGALAEPSLRKVLRGTPTIEVKRRAEKLIAIVADPVPPAKQLRQLRALVVLEEIGIPEARRIVESLAKGNPDVRLTWEARMALERLGKRSGTPLPDAPTRNADPKHGDER